MRNEHDNGPTSVPMMQPTKYTDAGISACRCINTLTVLMLSSFFQLHAHPCRYQLRWTALVCAAKAITIQAVCRAKRTP